MQAMSTTAEYIVIGFPGNNFTGEIVPALADLVESGTIRILDLVFVLKDADGNVLSFEYDDLEDLGYHDLPGEVTGILSDSDVAQAGELLEPNSSAVLLIWEDLWAESFAQAVRNADGVFVAGGRLGEDSLAAALADLND
jgi:uncharacterized membrane protein